MSDEAAPWYRTFFERDYFDRYYKRYLEPGSFLGPELTAQQVDFIERVLELRPGARLLDLCCGHGRHSIALARRGYEVTGLDLSAYHIELAQKAAAEAGVSATFICDDMRNLPVEPPFDAVINIFTSFGYFESDDENAKVITRVGQALKPGGRFLLDVNHVIGTLRSFRPSDVAHHDDGSMIIQERAYDAEAGRITESSTYIAPDGERTVHSFMVRNYTMPEFRRLIEAAGMRVLRTYGGFDGSPLTMDSRRLIVLAERAYSE